MAKNFKLEIVSNRGGLAGFAGCLRYREGFGYDVEIALIFSGGKFVRLGGLERNFCPKRLLRLLSSGKADRFFTKSGNQALNYRAAMLSLMGDLAVTVAP
ncbi:hypothetical protein [Cypionkella sp. TWP1-2-1b2]|uniref:hypothetical protein n=1 Tax=Cypionkella sp. TWP1-2-1b2 TaxID=2804675 RepID=UPI003CEBE68A